MEYSYLLKPKGRLTQDLDKRFERLSRFAKGLCDLCGYQCRGFMLTTCASRYGRCKGPKVGWGYYGDTVLMRICGCENLKSIRAIEDYIGSHGFVITKVTTSANAA
ncbi:MAG: hypothetical protein QF662_07210 [Phycisphaerae bacterium]|jgi:hypothetical protein|nr:hypothetical protein [Phycisphaerae bacterium]